MGRSGNNLTARLPIVYNASNRQQRGSTCSTMKIPNFVVRHRRHALRPAAQAGKTVVIYFYPKDSTSGLHHARPELP